jgi:hypothetical protein
MSRRSWLAAAVAFLPSPILAQATATSAAVSNDDAAVRRIVANLEADEPDPHVSPALDWENAFGIRYDNLKKRDAFYGAVVKPQFKAATDNTLETRVRFVTPDVAVADTYWHVVGQVYAGQTKAGPDRWGRTTYILKKEDGAWIEVIERVADLRLPYYRHITEVPKAAPVPHAVLESYVGRYTSPSGDADPVTVDVAVQGDHLTMTTRRGVSPAIPTSQTDFLVFLSPDDTAEYYKASFSNRNGVVSYALSEAWGESLGVRQKQPRP